MRYPGQGGIHESRRVGQGPRRLVDHPRIREERGPQTRRHRGRRDRGQYRHRHCPHLQCARLRVRDLHAGQPVAGEGRHPAYAWRGGPGGQDRTLRRRGELPEAGRAVRGNTGQRGLGQPVRQHREHPGALRIDRAGDLATDRRQGERFRLLRGDRRHPGRRLAIPEGAQCRCATGAVRLHGERAVQLRHFRRNGDEPGAVDHRGHR